LLLMFFPLLYFLSTFIDNIFSSLIFHLWFLVSFSSFCFVFIPMFCLSFYSFVEKSWIVVWYFAIKTYFISSPNSSTYWYRVTNINDEEMWLCSPLESFALKTEQLGGSQKKKFSCGHELRDSRQPVKTWVRKFRKLYFWKSGSRYLATTGEEIEDFVTSVHLIAECVTSCKSSVNEITNPDPLSSN
jgi:hypothetical protein